MSLLCVDLRLQNLYVWDEMCGTSVVILYFHTVIECDEVLPRFTVG